MSFLGGAAEQLSEVIETRERERLYEERLEKEQEFQLGTFAKKQAELAKIETKRAEDKAKKDAERAASMLALMYRPDQVEYIMSKGNGAVQLATERGNYYLDNNLVPSEMFEMPHVKAEITAEPVEATDAVTGSVVDQTDAMLEPTDTTFIGSFKPLPVKIEKAKSTWEAEIIKLNHGVQTSTGDTKAEYQRLLDNTYAEYEKWKKKTKEVSGAGDAIDSFSITTHEALLNSIVDAQFQGTELATMDAEGRFSQIVEGNEPEAYYFMNEAITGMRETLLDNPKVDDPRNLLPGLINIRQKANNAAIKGYKRNVALEYYEAKKDFESKPENKGVTFIQPESDQEFILEETGQPRSYEDVTRGMQMGAYRSGMVVQYTRKDDPATEVNEEGQTAFALITKYGVIG